MPTVRIGFEDVRGIAGADLLTTNGPTLHVHIGFDRTYRDGRSARPDIPEVPLPALVDTGAVKSCIDSNLAAGLGLPVVDRQMISSPHGVGAVSVHLAQIYVPGLEFVVNGRFAGAHLTAGGQPYFALLGRDFLENFTMIYEGRTGFATISDD